MNPVDYRIGRHAAKAHRKLVLQRCEELKMGDLRQQLIDSNKAEDDVAYAIHSLWTAISNLDRLRMANNTADLVLRDHEEIEGAYLQLRDLNSDIKASIYKAAAE